MDVSLVSFAHLATAVFLQTAQAQTDCMRILSGAFLSCPLTNSQLKSGPWLGCFRVLMFYLSHSCSFGFVPGFIVLLGSKSSPMLLESCKVSFRISLCCCICWTLISLPGTDAEKHLYGMMLLPPWSTVRMVCFWCSMCSLHTSSLLTWFWSHQATESSPAGFRVSHMLSWRL